MDLTPVTCKLCGKECKGIAALGSHKRTKHGVAGSSKNALTRTQNLKEQGGVREAKTNSRVTVTPSDETQNAEAQVHVAFIFGGVSERIRNYSDATAVSGTTLARGVAELLLAQAGGSVLGTLNHMPGMPRATAKRSYRRKTVAVADSASGQTQPSKNGKAGVSTPVRVDNIAKLLT